MNASTYNSTKKKLMLIDEITNNKSSGYTNAESGGDNLNTTLSKTPSFSDMKIATIKEAAK